MVKSYFIRLLLSLAFTFAAMSMLQAQAPPPPSENQSGQLNNVPLGGGAAPLAGGVTLMISMAAVYGINKVRRAKIASNL